jgi:hypothetical protein
MTSGYDETDNTARIRTSKVFYNFEHNEFQHQLLNVPFESRKVFNFFTYLPHSITDKVMTSGLGFEQSIHFFQNWLTFYYVLGTTAFMILYLILIICIQKRNIAESALKTLKESKSLCAES